MTRGRADFADCFGVVDAYRNKMRSAMVAGGQDVSTIAPHFETRPGKNKWMQRVKHAKAAGSP